MKSQNHFFQFFLLCTSVILSSLLILFKNKPIKQNNETPKILISPSPLPIFIPPSTWKTYSNNNIKISFQFPNNIEFPPEIRKSLPNDSNKYEVLEMGNKCANLYYNQHSSNKPLLEYLKFNFYKSNSDLEWLEIQKHIELEKQILIDNKYSINIGAMGEGEVANYFVQINSNEIGQITILTNYASNCDNARHKDLISIYQILSTFKFNDDLDSFINSLNISVPDNWVSSTIYNSFTLRHPPDWVLDRGEGGALLKPNSNELTFWLTFSTQSKLDLNLEADRLSNMKATFDVVKPKENVIINGIPALQQTLYDKTANKYQIQTFITGPNNSYIISGMTKDKNNLIKYNDLYSKIIGTLTFIQDENP